MGERGAFARILGPVVGNPIDFAHLGKPTAPGQWSVQVLVDTYRYPKLNAQTSLYGLIGNPVSQSLGDVFHNKEFANHSLNCVYVKMTVEADELSEFFPRAESLGFRGLSVTMPLKEKVLPAAGPINTLLYENGAWMGLNGDGRAALDSLGPVDQKHLVLLGAGGAARAIAYEAKRRGAKLTILNRTPETAEQLAREVGGSTKIPTHYDVLINCTPSSMPVDPDFILPSAQVMDIVYIPRETKFLQAAAKRGASIIHGSNMFDAQAQAQFDLWTIQKFKILGSELYVGKNILHLIPELCKRFGSRSAIIADPKMRGYVPGEMTFSCPEKTRSAKQDLEDQLFAAGFGRDSVFVGVGGGTTTDLVGFLASTYMRGVPLILVPTTLLGMVDASIGGKTAIDTPFGKNLIGAFYLPKAIVVDLNFLKTLPAEELINGQSEITKLALCADATLLELPFEQQIVKAMQVKAAIVEQDPTETGMRRVLNFGHTIGHAIESCSHLAHGKAVALGCIAESYLSHRLGFLSEADLQRIVAICPKLKWTFDRRALLQKMALDKKNAKGAIRFVLIDQVGHAIPFEGTYCQEVGIPDIEATFHWMETHYV